MYLSVFGGKSTEETRFLHRRFTGVRVISEGIGEGFAAAQHVDGFLQVRYALFLRQGGKNTSVADGSAGTVHIVGVGLEVDVLGITVFLKHLFAVLSTDDETGRGDVVFFQHRNSVLLEILCAVVKSEHHGFHRQINLSVNVIPQLLPGWEIIIRIDEILQDGGQFFRGHVVGVQIFRGIVRIVDVVKHADRDAVTVAWRTLVRLTVCRANLSGLLHPVAVILQRVGNRSAIGFPQSAVLPKTALIQIRLNV